MDTKEELINPLIFEETKKEDLIKPLVFEEKKGPEDRIYLLLYYFVDDNGDESKTFEFIKGRTEVRERIIADLAVGDVDIHRSRVLVEKAPLEDSLTLYAFMKLIEVYFEDKPFDIEAYNIGDVDEDELEKLDLDFSSINNDEDKEQEAQNIQEMMLGLGEYESEDI